MKNIILKEQLDSYDMKILYELQKDGRIAVADLAIKIGLSTTPCWRRVQ
ncbi:MAG: AsnC family protein, partial [Gammaproteobacteria bacterium]|nr:AsnC family protein [Gammaproteobacteria bacterium]